MLTYLVNGTKRRYPEGEAPEGAVLLTKKKVETVEPVVTETKKVEEPKSKAIKTPANKARKAGSNK